MIAAALLAASTAAAQPTHVVQEQITLPGYGTAKVYRPEPVRLARAVVLFVSGDGGWNLGVVDMARRAAARNTVVVGLSIWWAKMCPGGRNANAVTGQELSDMGRGATFYDVLVEVDVLVEEGELTSRAQGWEPLPPRYTRGVLAKYAKLVGSASNGARSSAPSPPSIRMLSVPPGMRRTSFISPSARASAQSSPSTTTTSRLIALDVTPSSGYYRHG